MESALPDTAQARIMSSLGSRTIPVIVCGLRFSICRYLKQARGRGPVCSLSAVDRSARMYSPDISVRHASRNDRR